MQCWIEDCDRCPYKDCVLDGVEALVRESAETALKWLRKRGIECSLDEALEKERELRKGVKKEPTKGRWKDKPQMDDEDYERIIEEHERGKSWSRLGKENGMSATALKVRVCRYRARSANEQN